MDTINIRSVKLHTPEPLCPATDGDCWERADAVTTTTNKDTTSKDPVLIRFFKAPAPNPLNGEALRAVVLQPISER